MLRRAFPKKGAVFNIVERCILGTLVSGCLLIVPTAGHSQKSYLDAIQLEAEKLDQPVTAKADEAESGSATAVDEQVMEFEQELETRFKGSYLFYKKLPARSQEEVFLEHQQGASVEDVRKTILNRYLHSR
jgi:hypothetical protein